MTYDPVADVATVFPGQIPADLITLWLEEVGEQLIFTDRILCLSGSEV